MKSLLAAVDFSEVTDRVLDAVVALAGPLEAQVRLIHVAAPDPEFVGYGVDSPELRDTHAAGYREEHRQLQDLGARLRERGVEAKALLIQGPTVEKILEEADRAEADLVIVGSHGHGALHRALLGSISEGLLRRSHRPLLIVPARQSGG